MLQATLCTTPALADKTPQPATEQSPRPPLPAPASPSNAPVQRTFVLQNGTELRAEVIEDDDEENYVLIKNPQGGTTRLARSQIRSVQVARAGARPAPSAMTPSANDIPDGLHLTLDSDSPEVQVQRVIATHTSFDFNPFTFGFRTVSDTEPFCPSHCNRWVTRRERDSRFLVTGVAGAEFRLPAEGSKATVHIHAGNIAARVGGFILMGAGGALAIGGGSLVFYGQQSSNLRYGLGVPLLIGGVVALGGSIAIVLKYRTVIRVESTAPEL